MLARLLRFEELRESAVVRELAELEGVSGFVEPRKKKIDMILKNLLVSCNLKYSQT